MLKTLKIIFELLSLKDKGQLYWLTAAVVMMAVLDMVGVASIFPFLNVISDPSIIERNTKLKWFYDTLNFSNTNTFLITLGGVSFALLVFNNVLRAWISVALIRFSYKKRLIISRELLAKYLYEPYAFFLNRNTSELTSYLVSEVARVVSGVLVPCLQMFARSLMALLIVVLLILINPTIAFIIITVLAGGYALIYAAVSKVLSRIGEGMTEYSKKIYRSLSEAFGGIKDIKLLGKEQVFIDKFSGSVKEISDCYCWQYMIFQLPKYAFEILVFGGVLFIAVYIAVIQKNYQNVVPIVGLYAFAAYRLMPTLQQIYSDGTIIRSSLPALEVVYQDFITCSLTEKSAGVKSEKCIPFTNEILFSGISFRYPKTQADVIKRLDLRIEANTTVGIVGGSGAGKTTLVDILLGLLRPQEGELRVDGVVINEGNLRGWQDQIGYVAQQIYLYDDTITRNIAFGVPDEAIDIDAVHTAAKLANIHTFISHELPAQYDTEVGERGVRISGGQLQRIGIARALYRNPPLLVFDEATSALDGITEEVILDAIRNLAHQKTIIIIAHRLTTVKECDIIYMLDQGKIIGRGSYQELLVNNQQFSKMAGMYENSEKALNG